MDKKERAYLSTLLLSPSLSLSDIDECASEELNSCPGNSVCFNLEPQYRCDCVAGYEKGPLNGCQGEPLASVACGVCCTRSECVVRTSLG